MWVTSWFGPVQSCASHMYSVLPLVSTQVMDVSPRILPQASAADRSAAQVVWRSTAVLVADHQWNRLTPLGRPWHIGRQIDPCQQLAKSQMDSISYCDLNQMSPVGSLNYCHKSNIRHCIFNIPFLTLRSDKPSLFFRLEQSPRRSERMNRKLGHSV